MGDSELDVIMPPRLPPLFQADIRASSSNFSSVQDNKGTFNGGERCMDDNGSLSSSSRPGSTTVGDATSSSLGSVGCLSSTDNSPMETGKSLFFDCLTAPSPSLRLTSLLLNSCVPPRGRGIEISGNERLGGPSPPPASFIRDIQEEATLESKRGSGGVDVTGDKNLPLLLLSSLRRPRPMSSDACLPPQRLHSSDDWSKVPNYPRYTASFNMSNLGIESPASGRSSNQLGASSFCDSSCFKHAFTPMQSSADTFRNIMSNKWGGERGSGTPPLQEINGTSSTLCPAEVGSATADQPLPATEKSQGILNRCVKQSDAVEVLSGAAASRSTPSRIATPPPGTRTHPNTSVVSPCSVTALGGSNAPSIAPFGSPHFFSSLRRLPQPQFVHLARSVARYRRSSRLDSTPSTIVSINICGCISPHDAPINPGSSAFTTDFWPHQMPAGTPLPGVFDAFLSVMLVELHPQLPLVEFLDRRLPAVIRQQVGNRLERNFVVQIAGISFLRQHLEGQGVVKCANNQIPFNNANTSSNNNNSDSNNDGSSISKSSAYSLWTIGSLPECTTADMRHLCSHPLYQHMLCALNNRTDIPTFRNLNLCPLLLNRSSSPLPPTDNQTVATANANNSRSGARVSTNDMGDNDSCFLGKNKTSNSSPINFPTSSHTHNIMNKGGQFSTTKSYEGPDTFIQQPRLKSDPPAQPAQVSSF